MIEININPVAFWHVRWYGILVAVSIAVLVLWIAWHVQKDKRISVDTVLIAAIVGIPSGVIVSRAIHVIDLWNYYVQHPGEIIGGMGLTIWGAIIGGVIGIWITSRFTKFKFGYFADVLAPGLILAQTIGRIGCTINGCCYGSACSLPWSISYVHPESLAPHGVAVHPTQVYEIIFLAFSFIVIMLLRNRLKPEGSLFFTYMGMYSAWRLGIGFLRDGTDFLFGLHQAQIIGIILLAIIIPVMVMKTRWGRPEIAIPESPETTDIPSDDSPVIAASSDTKEDSDASENDETEVKE